MEGGGMNSFIPVVVTIALLGSALVGGVFFAFSSFVMKALARIGSADGISAMQSIDVVVINRSFLGPFMGSAPNATEFWIHYLQRWTTWNHIRTGAAMIAVLLYTAGLMQSAAA
jgi:uncharacterized membrane protein